MTSLPVAARQWIGTKVTLSDYRTIDWGARWHVRFLRPCFSLPLVRIFLVGGSVSKDIAQLSKTSGDLSKMAAIYLVDVDHTPVYTQYFDISYIPSTVFFFNGQHMKVDYGVCLSILFSLQYEYCWRRPWLRSGLTLGRCVLESLILLVWNCHLSS
ncbi:thioredoxin-like protein 4B isoform X2 [Mus caroli]|uniref:Thioredoxin-like protein 4B isoform X2 n=1 Tax=Mus caroli TaxID=10089 RepID=A0A6P7RGT6_MUSCR|nr:thioredoxin-like protein 4B isoform X2 [Mus caroli]